MTIRLSRTFTDRCRSLGLTTPFTLDLDQVTDVAAKGLKDYLDKGHHGSMAWMADTYDRRAHAKALWPQARSAVILGLNYGPDIDPLVTLDHPDKASISVYARNRDYHDVFKGRLKELAGLLGRDTGHDVKVFVDTAPLMEKPLAQQAGLGWQGKHTNLVSKNHGSWLFIGTILTSAELVPTGRESDHCGSCQACLDICPTNAFPAPYQLDARRCISYLTIEHKGPVDRDLRPLMGNRIYGCDDCLAVCPWNKFAQAASDAKLQARDDLTSPALAELVTLDDGGFRRHFSGSPIKRIGRNRFIRNVLYAIGNSGMLELVTAASRHLNAEDSVVRDAAHWAVERLKEPDHDI